MKKSRFNENQIIRILKEQVLGRSVADIMEIMVLVRVRFTVGRVCTVGMALNQVKKLKSLEEELAQFKRMYDDLAFENNALKDLIENNLLGPMKKREAVGYLIDKQQLSIRWAYVALNLSTAAYYYRYQPKVDIIGLSFCSKTYI